MINFMIVYMKNEIKVDEGSKNHDWEKNPRFGRDKRNTRCFS